MEESVKEELIFNKVGRVPAWLLGLFGLLAVVGFGVFVLEAMGSGSGSDQAWQIFLVNFVFFTGIAQAGIVLSAAMRITGARWGRSVLRVSEAMGSFLPLAFLLLIVVFIGRDHILPYATQDYHNKELWLDMPLVVLRQFAGLAILTTLSLAYVYFSIRQDLGGLGPRLKGLAAWVASDWKGEEDKARCWKKLKSMAPAIAILFALIYTLIAFDFMMSLDPHWFSTLFGIYYCVGSFLGAICFTALLSMFLGRYMGLSDYMASTAYRDMGKLMLGFCLAWTYMFYSQLLPIWYANMPEETAFLIKRLQEPPFQTLAWTVASCIFLFPLVALISKLSKLVLPIFAFIATVPLCGLWLEKIVIIEPSLTPELHITAPQLIITLGFLSLFVLAFLLFVRTFPMMPVGDPFFEGKVSEHTGGH